MNGISILLYLALLTGIGQQTTIPPGAIKGDFDGDGKPEYVWLVKPQLAADGMSCNGNCSVQLVCSNPRIKTITINNSIGGTLTNLGDLNGDGKDEIGLLPEWFTSCWRNFLTYTLNNNDWTYLTQPFPTHCNQWEDNIKPLEKLNDRPGYLLENYSAFENNQIVVKQKIVKAK